MSTGTATNDVIDKIAHIETHRQEMGREADAAAAGGEALRKLHELLEHERAALQLHATSTTHPVNIEAVTIEIKRVKELAGVTHAGPVTAKAGSQPQPASRPNPPHNPARNNVRRTMGRRGDR